jgi:hypothetical protein
MKTHSHSNWARYAAIAVAVLFAIGFAAMATINTAAEEDGDALSSAAGEPSQFVMSGGAVPDSEGALPSSTAVAHENSASTVVARIHKN